MADNRTPWIGTSQYKVQNRLGLPDETPKPPKEFLKDVVTKQTLCKECGHKKIFHMNINNECEVCDDPTIKIEDKCMGFKV